MKLVYVCTNFNNYKYTAAAVDSLSTNFGQELSIFVVDNASNNSERERLRNLQRNNTAVRVIFSEENVGYFPGLNLGISAALKEDPKTTWMLVGNNDLEFPFDFVNKVEQNLEKFSMYAVISPDIVTLDGQHQNPHVLSRISTTREIFYDIYYSNYWVGLLVYKIAKLFPRITRRGDEDHWETAQPIYQGHGSCYLLTPRFFSLFDELWAPTFMMSEEFFLSLQLKKACEQVFYSPEISVTHHWHGSLQDVPSRGRWKMARDAHRVYRKYVKVFKGLGL